MLRLLVVSGWFPYPINGAKIRTLNLIRQLAKLGQVDLISLVRTLTSSQLEIGIENLKSFCSSVHTVPGIPYEPGATFAFRKLIDSLPDSVRMTRNLDLEYAVATAYRNSRYDCVIVTESGAPGVPTFAVTSQGIRPLIVDSIEFGVMRPAGSWLSSRRWRMLLTWIKGCGFSRSLLRKADVFTVASLPEYHLFRRIAPQGVDGLVVPNGIDLSDYEGYSGHKHRKHLIFSGSFSYPVNYQAVQWFATRVWKYISMKDEMVLRVTGNTAGCDLTPITQSCPQTIFTGFVDDVKSLIAQSGISIAPILSGGSTRIKIVEAMALGTPVVSTRVGAEGLNVVHGENILIADKPEEFAYHVEQLVNNDELWRHISYQGQLFVQNEFSAEIIGRIYGETLSKLVNRDFSQALGN